MSFRNLGPSKLPHPLMEPVDELRTGLGMGDTTMTERPVHAVEEIQKTSLRNKIAMRDELNTQLFGKHHAIRVHRERNALAQFRRAAGLKSSLVALETSLGLRHDIDWSDVLNTPEKRETSVDIHSLMETRQNNESPKFNLPFRY